MPSPFKKPLSKSKRPKKKGAKSTSSTRTPQVDIPPHNLERSFLENLPVIDPNIQYVIQNESVETLLSTPLYVDPVLHHLVQKESKDSAIFDDYSEYELGKHFLETINTNNLSSFLVLLKLKDRLNPCFNNNMALLKAIELNRESMVYALLLDSRVDPRQGSIAPITLAIQLKHESIGRLLFNHPLVVYSFFIQAVRDNKLTIVKSILSKYPTFYPSHDNNKALKMAIEKNNIKIIELLLSDKRLEPSLEDNLPLRYAQSLKRNVIVKFLENDYRVKFKKLLLHIENNETQECLALFDECFCANRFALQEVQLKIFAALRLTIHHNRLELYRKLLDLAETNLGYKDFYLMKLICMIGNLQMLNLALIHLKERHPYVKLDRQNGHDCFKLALIHKHYQCIESLLLSGLFDPGANHNEALLFTLYNGDYRMFSLVANDPRVNVTHNEFALHYEALKVHNLSYFELLYKLTPLQHLNHVHQVIEASYAASEAVGSPINKDAIEAIKQKYQQPPLTPFYSMQIHTRFISQAQKEALEFANTVLNNDMHENKSSTTKKNEKRVW